MITVYPDYYGRRTVLERSNKMSTTDDTQQHDISKVKHMYFYSTDRERERAQHDTMIQQRMQSCETSIY